MLRMLMAATIAVAAAASVAVAQEEAVGAQEAGVGAPAELYAASGENAQTKLAKAAKIFELAMPRSRFAGVLGRLQPMLEQTIRDESQRAGKPPPEGAAERLAAILADELTLLMTEMQPKIIPIYAGALTENELDALLALYSSREGRSVLQKLPLLSDRVAQAMRGDLIVFRNRVEKRVAAEFSGAEE